MWYIERIGSIIDNGPMQSVNCLCLDSAFKMSNGVFLWLRDSVTGETADLIGYNRPWDEFESKVKAYSPYGCMLDGYSRDELLFVSVDDKSLKFLDYVDSVAPVGGDISTDTRSYLEERTIELMPLDEYGTIFGVGSAYKLYSFPLLQVMCFSSGGWFGSSYYFQWREKFYRVLFNDAHKARAYIGKLASEGYNPVLQYASELRFLSKGSTLVWE